MISSQRSSVPVHFEGEWTEPEADMVAAAVAEAEGGLQSNREVASWVAIRHASDSTDVFAVSRVGFPTVVSAQSVTALAEEIRCLDLSQAANSILATGSGGQRI